MSECVWRPKEDAYGDTVYVTDCGEMWSLIDGTPHDNSMWYCPSCGATLVVRAAPVGPADPGAVGDE